MSDLRGKGKLYRPPLEVLKQLGLDDGFEIDSPTPEAFWRAWKSTIVESGAELEVVLDAVGHVLEHAEQYIREEIKTAAVYEAWMS
jgi:hypothetical protein